MQHLPSDILTEIFRRYINPVDSLQTSLVCRYFHHVIHTDAVWRHHHCTHIPANFVRQFELDYTRLDPEGRHIMDTDDITFWKKCWFHWRRYGCEWISDAISREMIIATNHRNSSTAAGGHHHHHHQDQEDDNSGEVVNAVHTFSKRHGWDLDHWFPVCWNLMIMEGTAEEAGVRTVRDGSGDDRGTFVIINAYLPLDNNYNNYNGGGGGGNTQDARLHIELVVPLHIVSKLIRYGYDSQQQQHNFFRNRVHALLDLCEQYQLINTMSTAATAAGTSTVIGAGRLYQPVLSRMHGRSGRQLYPMRLEYPFVMMDLVRVTGRAKVDVEALQRLLCQRNGNDDNTEENAPLQIPVVRIHVDTLRIVEDAEDSVRHDLTQMSAWKDQDAHHCEDGGFFLQQWVDSGAGEQAVTAPMNAKYIQRHLNSLVRLNGHVKNVEEGTRFFRIVPELPHSCDDDSNSMLDRHRQLHKQYEQLFPEGLSNMASSAVGKYLIRRLYNVGQWARRSLWSFGVGEIMTVSQQQDTAVKMKSLYAINPPKNCGLEWPSSLPLESLEEDDLVPIKKGDSVQIVGRLIYPRSLLVYQIKLLAPSLRYIFKYFGKGIFSGVLGSLLYFYCVPKVMRTNAQTSPKSGFRDHSHIVLEQRLLQLTERGYSKYLIVAILLWRVAFLWIKLLLKVIVGSAMLSASYISAILAVVNMLRAFRTLNMYLQQRWVMLFRR